MSKIIGSSSEWTDEYLDGVRYGLQGKTLINEKSAIQQIKLIQTTRYGKALLLDGCWMTSEFQEKQYHECLVHPALCGAKNISKVLIIGGGDGGTARECLRYKELKYLDLVEIDKRVVEISKKYLSGIGGNAWNDSRLKLTIADGIQWVKDSAENSYDVIIVDGSDPVGPAEGLFNKNFLLHCKRILRPYGVFATQSESPEAFQKIHIEMVQTIREIFDYADPIYGCVPMYPSGWWSWTFASQERPFYKEPILKRANENEIEKKCEIWSLRWQRGAFEAIPSFIERKLCK